MNPRMRMDMHFLTSFQNQHLHRKLLSMRLNYYVGAYACKFSCLGMQYVIFAACRLCTLPQIIKSGSIIHSLKFEQWVSEDFATLLFKIFTFCLDRSKLNFRSMQAEVYAQAIKYAWMKKIIDLISYSSIIVGKIFFQWQNQ